MESADRPEKRAYLSLLARPRSIEKMKAKKMSLAVQSRKLAQESITKMQNRLKYIEREIDTSEKQQRVQFERSQKLSQVRENHSELVKLVKESHERLQQENSEKKNKVNQDRTQLLHKIGAAQEKCRSHKQSSGDAVRAEKEEIKQFIGRNVESARANRQRHVQLSREKNRVYNSRNNSSKDLRQRNSSKLFQSRLDSEVSLKEEADEYLKVLEQQEELLLSKLRYTSEISYRKFQKPAHSSI